LLKGEFKRGVMSKMTEAGKERDMSLRKAQTKILGRNPLKGDDVIGKN